jgi:hypothetical protein
MSSNKRGNARLRRAAAVVFEHVVLAICAADQIAAADVDVDVAWHIDPAELRAVMLRLFDVKSWDHLVLEDLLVMVDVVEKQIQGHDSLGQTGLERFPFMGWHHPWYRIKRKYPFGPLLVMVDIEGDALAEEIELGIRFAG